jgi:hypothetical protein
MSFKKAFFIALFFLLVTNLGWLYVFINQAVTYDHTREEYKHLIKDIKLMKKLMTDFGKHENKEQMVKILKDRYSDYIIKEEEGILFVDRIGLKFDGNNLTEIVFMNEL